MDSDDFAAWMKIWDWLKDAKPGDSAVYGSIFVSYEKEVIKFSRIVSE